MTKEICNKNRDIHSIKKSIETYIKKTVYIDNEKIKYDSLIFKEGFFDSMGFIRLIAFIEEEFGIKINDDELVEENFESIIAITIFISRKLQQLICAE